MYVSTFKVCCIDKDCTRHERSHGHRGQRVQTRVFCSFHSTRQVIVPVNCVTLFEISCQTTSAGNLHAGALDVTLQHLLWHIYDIPTRPALTHAPSQCLRVIGFEAHRSKRILMRPRVINNRPKQIQCPIVWTIRINAISHAQHVPTSLGRLDYNRLANTHIDTCITQCVA